MEISKCPRNSGRYFKCNFSMCALKYLLHTVNLLFCWRFSIKCSLFFCCIFSCVCRLYRMCYHCNNCFKMTALALILTFVCNFIKYIFLIFQFARHLKLLLLVVLLLLLLSLWIFRNVARNFVSLRHHTHTNTYISICAVNHESEVVFFRLISLFISMTCDNKSDLLNYLHAHIRC